MNESQETVWNESQETVWTVAVVYEIDQSHICYIYRNTGGAQQNNTEGWHINYGSTYNQNWWYL